MIGEAPPQPETPTLPDIEHAVMLSLKRKAERVAERKAKRHQSFLTPFHRDSATAPLCECNWQAAEFQQLSRTMQVNVILHGTMTLQELDYATCSLCPKREVFTHAKSTSSDHALANRCTVNAFLGKHGQHVIKLKCM